MRDPDQLPSVLHSLLAHPALKTLLKKPQVLTNFLDKHGWMPLPEEPDDMEDEESEEVQTYYRAMDRWDQIQMDYGEYMEAVERQVIDLKLTLTEEQTLRTALIQACPDCRGTLAILVPSRFAIEAGPSESL